MKTYVIFILAFILVIAPNKAWATVKGYDKVATSSKDDITLYAKKIDGFYYDFKIDFKGRIASRPFWLSVANNPTYAPKIIYEDTNRDGKKELIIILNQGYGTGVLLEEIYVFEIGDNQFGEVIVDHPLAVVMKNAKTSLTPTEAKISIGNKHDVVDLSAVGMEPENVFKDIFFGGIIKYEVENNHLIARLAAQVSPSNSIGEVIIIYEYRDKMYQAKSVDFHPYK
ncbi:hypothetical protein [Lysinibacillus sp. SGAir0095]|uniref:hypothetical protein n=1 Tax=Lysinibacillus sp. SGAir0095 TaxID=2070463 RepID=UPI0010CD6B98|nr:hypothetical protein [Lysinibacillus sp. SGAir0095]QCR31067.1 hypothetical protein C1N55_02335 [Lysinibacillus sp. SGAir0095]